MSTHEKEHDNEAQVEHSLKETDQHGLSEEHRQYLLSKHGTVDLDPMPHMSDADPLNWPKWKKTVNLALVAFHGMMATFTAASIQCAFVDIAKDLNVSVPRTSYLSSLVIVVLGGAPLLWRPLAHVYGRRPIFLLGLICSLVGNVGCAVGPTFATQALCRAITAFFICPAAILGSAVVSECYFRRERARYMGIWTIMFTLGVPIAPFIFGFVAMRVGYRWIYWIMAITNGVQFILHVFFGPETRYIPSTTSQAGPKSSLRSQYFSFRRMDPTPLTLNDFIHPLSYFANPNVLIASCAYAMIFLFGSIMTTFEIPQIFPEKFGLNTQQVGLQYLSVIVGTVIGEQFGGLASDKWMWLREKKGLQPKPEYRLWLSYGGHLLTICGLVVFLVQIENATNQWNITPIVGAAIAAAGNQVVTTVNITYCVDCNPSDAAAIGVFIAVIRQGWGFIGPFWFPVMIRNIGLVSSAGVVVALIIGVSTIPTMILQLKGGAWRKRRALEP